MFAGKKAITANQHTMTLAQQRLAAGEDVERVRKETGWHCWVDGGMRFEISDNNAQLNDAGWYEDSRSDIDGDLRKMDGYLGDYRIKFPPRVAERLGYSERIENGLLTHPELFAAYPWLAGIKLVVLESNHFLYSERGHYQPGSNKNIYMEINPSLGGNAVGAILHEVQHAIQCAEGFSKGGGPQVYLENFHNKIDLLAAEKLRWGQALRAGKLINDLQDELEALGEDVPNADYLVWLRNIADLDQYRQDAQVSAALSLGGYERVYLSLAGEVEACNVQARRLLTADERLALSPSLTAPTADDEVIVWVSDKDDPLYSEPPVFSVSDEPESVDCAMGGM